MKNRGHFKWQKKKAQGIGVVVFYSGKNAMAKKFLYITDPLDSLDIHFDTTLALMAEAASRGIESFACEIGDINVHDGKLHFHAAAVEIAKGYTKVPQYLSSKNNISADEFRVIFMRKDPPVDENFMASLFMLRCYDAEKTLFINDPDALLIANEKLFGQQIASHLYPPTLVSSYKKDLLEFLAQHKKAVFKPLFGAGGSGVLVFEQGDLNVGSALEMLSAAFSRPVMAQAYVEKAREGDKRILLLGGEVLGAVLRVPDKSDHRANFHAGGSAKACKLTQKEYEICSHLRPYLLELGLHFVGIDVIDNFLTEINVTSPTCILQMSEDLPGKVIDYIDHLIA
ncbi:MAG: glutathione synthase [Myxococcales bacterium]|nr:MAG: glutathione synthase [Myxococcales bacterium]